MLSWRKEWFPGALRRSRPDVNLPLTAEIDDSNFLWPADVKYAQPLVLSKSYVGVRYINIRFLRLRKGFKSITRKSMM